MITIGNLLLGFSWDDKAGIPSTSRQLTTVGSVAIGRLSLQSDAYVCRLKFTLVSALRFSGTLSCTFVCGSLLSLNPTKLLRQFNVHRGSRRLLDTKDQVGGSLGSELTAPLLQELQISTVLQFRNPPLKFPGGRKKKTTTVYNYVPDLSHFLAHS